MWEPAGEEVIFITYLFISNKYYLFIRKQVTNPPLQGQCMCCVLRGKLPEVIGFAWLFRPFTRVFKLPLIRVHKLGGDIMFMAVKSALYLWDMSPVTVTDMKGSLQDVRRVPACLRCRDGPRPLIVRIFFNAFIMLTFPDKGRRVLWFTVTLI